jgi:hypothetical protein
MRSCAKHPLILPRRSSTAAASDGPVHCGSSGPVWGRADLRRAADRPSTYHRHHARQIDPTPRPARAQRDDDLRLAIQRVYDEHHQVYGSRTVWKQLRRQGVRVARCTVGRLMRAMGLAGAVRGRTGVTTTQAGAEHRAADLVDRQFVAPRRISSGLGLHVRRDVERIRLCGVHRRRLRAAPRGLAGVQFAAHRLRARRGEQFVEHVHGVNVEQARQGTPIVMGGQFRSPDSLRELTTQPPCDSKPVLVPQTGVDNPF